MLKEEKELRRLVLVCPVGCDHCKPIRKAITAFRRACYEDAAKRAIDALDALPIGEWDHRDAVEAVIAAIRKGGR